MGKGSITAPSPVVAIGVNSGGVGVQRAAPTPTFPAGRFGFLGFANINGAVWAAGIVTITTAITHNYGVGAFARINDVTPSGYNGTYVILTTPSATTFTYALAADPGTYSAGSDYVTLEPELQLIPSSARGTAAMFMSHPDAVALGLDPGLPIMGCCDGADGNYLNKGWFIAADGHSMLLYAGGNQKWFANGFVDARTADCTFGWTSALNSPPDTPANVDTQFQREAAGVVAFRKGTAPHELRVYATESASLANYERLAIRFSGGRFEICTQKLGTGASRNILVSAGAALILGGAGGTQWNVDGVGMFAPIVDNATDFGDATHRVRRSHQSEYTELSEMTAPAAPAANRLRFFSQDNGSGKTQLMVLFPTGVAQQVAIEP